MFINLSRQQTDEAGSPGRDSGGGYNNLAYTSSLRVAPPSAVPHLQHLAHGTPPPEYQTPEGSLRGNMHQAQVEVAVPVSTESQEVIMVLPEDDAPVAAAAMATQIDQSEDGRFSGYSDGGTNEHNTDSGTDSSSMDKSSAQLAETPPVHRSWVNEEADNTRL